MLAVLEKCFLVVGLCAASYCVYVMGESALLDHYANERFAGTLANTVSEGSVELPAPGDVVGRLEIPRLAMTSIIRAGVDARALRLGVGFIPGTAPPGHAGNMGLAGHRDTWFRALRGIAADDDIRVVTARGTFTYRVVRTVVVEPDAMWVLYPTTERTLTLVTCYPFSFVGSASQRFVVTARLVETPRTVAARW